MKASREDVARVVEAALLEDLPDPSGLDRSDPTTTAWLEAVMPSHELDQRVVARFVSNCDGVLAGTFPAQLCFELLDPEAEVSWIVKDGEYFRRGTVLGTVTAPMRTLAAGERTALNFLCHLSGIATAARRLVERARKTNPSIVVRDTRKTLPGLRVLEKQATASGGMVNHRHSLADGVLLKDTHIDLLRLRDGRTEGQSRKTSGVTEREVVPRSDIREGSAEREEPHGLSQALREFVRRARERVADVEVEIEADDLRTALAAAEAGADVVLCDNMTPGEVAEVVAALGGKAKVEASGGITEDNIASYAASGADYIAVGAVTHSAKACDISFEVHSHAIEDDLRT